VPDDGRRERPQRPPAMSRTVAAVLALVLLVAGCGGGGDEPKTMTKERYVADGDVVCAGLTDKFAAAGATDPRTPEEIAQSADVLADLYGQLRKGLQDIKLPADPAERRGAAAYVAAVRRTDPALTRLRSSAQRFVIAAQGQDGREIAAAGNAVRAALDAFRAAQAKADGRALDYGFDYCGNLN
jgi:hypothetical protein